MGLFGFVKDVGERLLGKDDDPHAALINFRTYLKDHDIDPKDLRFAMDTKGKLTVGGYLGTQESREKAVVLLGNVKGVEEVDDRIIVGLPPQEQPLPEQEALETDGDKIEQPSADHSPSWQTRTYTVVSGDTLGGIAKKMYGNASKYPVIFEANRPMLKDPNKIYPGQVLRIPDVAS